MITSKSEKINKSVKNWPGELKAERFNSAKNAQYPDEEEQEAVRQHISDVFYTAIELSNAGHPHPFAPIGEIAELILAKTGLSPKTHYVEISLDGTYEIFSIEETQKNPDHEAK